MRLNKNVRDIIILGIMIIAVLIFYVNNVNADTDNREVVDKIEFNMELNPKSGETPIFNGKLIGDTKDLFQFEETWASIYGKSTRYAYVTNNEEHNGYIKEDEKDYGESYANPVFLDKFEDGEYVYSVEIYLKDTSKYKVDKNTKLLVNGKEIDIGNPSTSGVMYRSEIYKVGNYVSDEASQKEQNNATKVINNMINNSDKGIEILSDDIYNKVIDEKQIITTEIKTEKKPQRDFKQEELEKSNALMTNEDKLIGYYDIEITLNTEEYGTIAYARELPEKIEVSLPIPSDLPKLQSGMERKFYVIRVHNGVAEKIEAVNNNNGTITFKSDKFSTYTEIYEDVKSEFKLGDVNQDGKVNAQDATLILKNMAKKATLTDEQKVLADTDKDGKIKASDAVRILKYVTKKISEI